MWLEVGKIRLDIVDILKYERSNIYSPDQNDLIGIRKRLGLVCTYAFGGMPKMTSVTKLAPETKQSLDGTDPTGAVLVVEPRGFAPDFRRPELEFDLGGAARAVDEDKWHSGPETDAELFLQLMQPRQRTILWAWSRKTGKPIRWLEAPRPRFKVDDDDGPRPLACDVVGTSGEPTTVTIYYEFETVTQPCPAGSDRLVLSHRWEMSHEPDEHHYLSRIIKGTVVFSAAVLDHLKVEPDSLRNQLLHPIPVGFERSPPTVTLSSDGHVLKYVVVDVDPTITFDPGTSGATEIKIMEKIIYNVPISFQR